jgi:hypothetical protein
VKTIGDIRRENLEALITEAGTLEKLAAAASTSPQYLSQIRNQTLDVKTGRPREMGTAMARRLEEAGRKTSGWMDAEHAPGAAPVQAPPPRPNPRFIDRHDVSQSDFDLLQDIKVAMESARGAAMVDELRKEAADMNAYAAKLIERGKS